MFITTIYKHSRKVKVNRNYVSKCNLYLHFLIWQNLLISSEKMVMSPEIKGCVTWFIYFLDLLWVRYNCAKFHHCRICATYFRERGYFCPSTPPFLPTIRQQPRKIPSWIGLKSSSKKESKDWKIIFSFHYFPLQHKLMKKVRKILKILLFV